MKLSPISSPSAGVGTPGAGASAGAGPATVSPASPFRSESTSAGPANCSLRRCRRCSSLPCARSVGREAARGGCAASCGSDVGGGTATAVALAALPAVARRPLSPPLLLLLLLLAAMEASPLPLPPKPGGTVNVFFPVFELW